MVSFTNAIRLGFQHYSDFTTRSTRAEYWWWALFALGTDWILTLIDVSLGTYNEMTSLGLLSGLFGLGTLIPSLALGARRLHDINKSGWWQLLWVGILLIIPVIILLWWAAKPSDEGPNQRGPDPRQVTPQLGS